MASRYTILVADDNEDVRNLLKTYLELNDYRVLEAKNGKEAIEIAKTRHPDLILMDLNMPVIDGIKAIGEIRRVADLENTPILVNSADGLMGIEFFLNSNKFGSGYIDYLAKPLNYNDLAGSIKTLITKFSSQMVT